MTTQEVPAITVAVCTRNRAELLRETLGAILRQRCRAPWELLVIDNGSTDGTSEVLATSIVPEGQGAVSCRTVIEARPGADHARNRALEAASGEIVVFADDDVTPLPGWLEAFRRAFQDPAVLAAAGRIFPSLPDDIPEWVRPLARQIGGPPARYDFGRVPGPIDPKTQSMPFGGNMACRRQAALDVGGFSTAFGYGRELIPGEDTELSFRLLGAGGVIAYVPAATVLHRVPAEKLDLEYFTAWWRGLGRSRRINRQLEGTVSTSHAPSRTRTLQNLLKYSLRRARHPKYSAKWLRAIERQSIARGELS